jgi:release factor glutamine methyltransferase
VSDGNPCVSEAIAEARSAGVATLDARLMLARLMAVTRTWLIAHDDARLDTALWARWQAWLQRRTDGEPLAYLLGEKEFHGLRFEVSSDVLVPRPESELLVDWARALLDADPARRDVVDLGTGSGAIALSIAHLCPEACVVATDASEAALAMASRNAQRLNLTVEFVFSSWWDQLAARRFDIVVANPPYVRHDDPALLALRHEPRLALTDGADGLVALRTIVAAAPGHLRADGWLVVEHGFDQADEVCRMFSNAGFADIETRLDLARLPRATGGRRRPSC